MKPSLEQLKESREVRRQAMESHDALANIARREMDQYDAQIAAEEEREAKAKEWPQVGDTVWFIDDDCAALLGQATPGSG